MTDTLSQELMPAASKAITSPISFGDMGVFGGNESFALAQRMATCLASSNYVPVNYQLRWFDDKKNEWHDNPNAIGNCVMALELANRWKLSPLMVMQNVDMVRGRPGLRGALVKGLIDTSGLFRGLTRYEWRGDEDAPTACRLTGIDKVSDELINGAWITLDMAKAEGWLSNTKWTSMRPQMFMYRAASFFGRAHTPHLLLGLPSAEEIEDIDPMPTVTPRASVANLNQRLENGTAPLPDIQGQDVTQDDLSGQTASAEEKPPQEKRQGRRPRNSLAEAKPPLEQAEPAANGTIIEKEANPLPEKKVESLARPMQGVDELNLE